MLAIALNLGCASWFEARESSDAFAAEVLALIDSGRQQELWSVVSRLVVASTDERLFLKRIFGIREAHGAVISRRHQTNWEREWVNAAPEGEYRQIIYWTEFEHEKNAEEYLLVSREDGVWRLISYRLR